MYDEWLTDRSWEVIKLSKFSFAHEQAPHREATFGIYSSTVSRGADVDLAQSGLTCRTKCTQLGRNCPSKVEIIGTAVHVVEELLRLPVNVVNVSLL